VSGTRVEYHSPLPPELSRYISHVSAA
jgi:hypothetical protein